MEIKSKVELKTKGEIASLPTVKQLVVTLSWSSAVDLDLMAFYTTKDGTHGACYSDQISQDIKSLGDLNNFPFMKLSGDAGVGKETEGDESEELKIIKLDDIAMVRLVALNYKAVKAKDAEASFSDLNGHITILTEKGEVFDVPLNNTDKGTVAHIATIDNTSPIGAQLKMEDTVMNLGQLVETIPGADALTK